MKRKVLLAHVLCILALLALPVGALAQDGDESDLAIDVALNVDAFFGAYPSLVGGYPINDKTSFTFYGIMWGYGTGDAWANWTEFGVGVNYTAGGFDINPQLGFTMGSLLSSGVGAEPGTGVVGDGIVPNLTVNYGDDLFEGQLYAGYYAALRDEAEEPGGSGSTNNYVHYWINAGVKAASFVSIGGHFEELYLSGGSNIEDQDGYRWIGPYVQFSKGNAGVRFAAGADLTENDDPTDEDFSFSNNEFYKMTFSLGF
jgi:hypothetical protein